MSRDQFWAILWAIAVWGMVPYLPLVSFLASIPMMWHIVKELRRETTAASDRNGR